MQLIMNHNVINKTFHDVTNFLSFQATALEMIHDIREAFNDLLEENEWMDTETRHVAEDKANSMTERIGYPEYITNDTRLEEEYQNVSF